jgi:hypothetical protein
MITAAAELVRGARAVLVLGATPHFVTAREAPMTTCTIVNVSSLDSPGGGFATVSRARGHVSRVFECLVDGSTVLCCSEFVNGPHLGLLISTRTAPLRVPE